MNVREYDYQKKLDELLSTGKKRSYAVAAVTVFFILLMSFAGIIPALSSLGTQHEQNIKRDELISKLGKKLDTLKDFVREEDDKKSLINFLNSIFPDKFPEKDSLNELVELSTKNNLNIDSYSFTNPDNGVQELVTAGSSVNTKVLNINFTGNGGLTNIQNFVKDLESSRRILDIVDVVIIKKLGNEVVEGKEFDITVSLRIYYYSTEASAE